MLYYDTFGRTLQAEKGYLTKSHRHVIMIDVEDSILPYLRDGVQLGEEISRKLYRKLIQLQFDKFSSRILRILLVRILEKK